MYKTSLGSVTDEVEALLVEKLSAKGQDLQQKIKSVGRRLPKRIRAQAAYLIEVEARCKNPKHAHEYDPARVLDAQKQCVAHLERIDPKAQRSRRRLGWFTALLVNMFFLAVLFAVALHFLG